MQGFRSNLQMISLRLNGLTEGWWSTSAFSKEDIIPKIVNTLLNLKLCEADSGKYVSVLDLPGIVLIVPKATLGGKAKGKGMQYHPNIGKEEGLQLYSKCVSLCEKELALSSDVLWCKDGSRLYRAVRSTEEVKALLVQHHDNNSHAGNHKTRTPVFTTGALSHQTLKSGSITKLHQIRSYFFGTGFPGHDGTEQFFPTVRGKKQSFSVCG
ncbi:hypothetical protein J4Q44_G00226010 [Coregonus suidteri]|uniref:D-aminoacyl-tRNA deacylase n=1 Tax=Coregonus suidteri TaxID=861788 RepID=A0AAN8L8U7_9TELE